MVKFLQAGGNSKAFKNGQSYGGNMREFMTTFNPLSTTGNPIPMQNAINSNNISYSQNLHQLHLKKILQQEEIIKNLNQQLSFANKNIQKLQQ